MCDLPIISPKQGLSHSPGAIRSRHATAQCNYTAATTCGNGSSYRLTPLDRSCHCFLATRAVGALRKTRQILTVQTHSPKLTSFLLKPGDAILFPGSPVSCMRAPLWSGGKWVCGDTATTAHKGQGDECRKSRKHSMPTVSISSESRLSWPKYTRNHS